MFKFILLATIIGAALAGAKNKCPWVMGKYPFEETKFNGDWYLVSAIMDRSFTCGKFNYQAANDVHTIKFSGKQADGVLINGESFGQPLFGKSEKNANLLAVWKRENGNYTGIYKQSIVATDYDNYAVFIGCRNVFDETNKTFNRHIKAAILGRKPTLPAETVSVLKNIISGYDIDVNTMKTIEHNNC